MSTAGQFLNLVQGILPQEIYSPPYHTPDFSIDYKNFILEPVTTENTNSDFFSILKRQSVKVPYLELRKIASSEIATYIRCNGILVDRTENEDITCYYLFGSLFFVWECEIYSTNQSLLILLKYLKGC